MKKSAEHSRRTGSNGQGKKGKGWRSHPRRSVPADCIGPTSTATADHARPGTVSGPAADHLRTATTTGTEGQRTGSGPASRRLSSGCTRPARAAVAFTTKIGGNCCHNCLLWQQFRHLQQVFTLSETRPASPPPLRWSPADQLTSWTADHGPGWVGGWFTDLDTESAQNLSTTLPPPPMFSHPCPFFSDIGGVV